MSLIPEDVDQLNIYFPRFYMNGGTLSTKCKIRSSIPVKDLKWKMLPKLQNLDYWITPSQLKATRTGKAGWILGGHSELTHRPEFQSTLKPLIEKRFQKQIEFQVEPETESMSVGNKRVSQRVLMVRCPLQEVENIRALFSELFSDDTEEDIGFLARYRFITTHPMGLCTRKHLQAILKSQQDFHKTIHYFIIYGIANLETMFITNDHLKNPPSPKDSSLCTPPHQSQEADTSTTDTVMENASIMEQDEEIPQESSTNASTNSSQQTKEKDLSQDSSNETDSLVQMSPRLFFYLCQSVRTNSNLFHSVYPSTETNKIYALCTQDNMDEALTLLHNLDMALSAYFSDDIIQSIMVKHEGKATYVKDFPKMTAQYKSYANVLRNLVPDSQGNPQEQDEEVQVVHTHYKSYASATTSNATPGSPVKRSRAGEAINQVTPHKTSRLPRNFVENTQHTQLHSTVTESIARMRNLENSQGQLSKSMETYGIEISKINTTMEVYGDDITKMSTSIANNSTAIKDIRDAQVQQANTIEKLADVQHQMLQSVNTIVHFNETVIKPRLVDTPDDVRGKQS